MFKKYLNSIFTGVGCETNLEWFIPGLLATQSKTVTAAAAPKQAG